MKTHETKILIVEDEDIISFDIKMILEGMGVIVTAIARSPDEAISAIEADPPHLVLLDLSLSGALEGVDLARAIQKRWTIPVLFISGHLGDTAVSGLEEINAAGYIAKPFYPINLREAVENAISSLAS